MADLGLGIENGEGESRDEMESCIIFMFGVLQYFRDSVVLVLHVEGVVRR